jgi:tape measure domain-containing protein
MPSIDERVVAMAFENTKFEAGVAQTMGSLTRLDSAIKKIGTSGSGFADIEKAANKVTLQQPMSALDKLKARLFGAGSGAQQGMSDIEKAGSKVSLQGPMSALDKLRSRLFGAGTGAQQGMADIEKAADQVDFAGMTRALDGMGSHFTALQSIAFGVFASIGAKLAGLAHHITNAFGLGVVKAGFENYETQINAVQTILANTGLKGKKGLNQVSGALNNLNRYANLTVYNFSEMARNIGTFTAAGVDLKSATAAIKGIANLAAMSGSTSQQASSAMYQLSQAIAAGRVNLQDWNSVVNAGIGGKVFQQALANTAVAMGKLGDHSVKLVGPMKQLRVEGQTFRNSIMTQGGAPSWLTSDVLTKTLEQFTGDMSHAQLVAQGFTDSQAKAIQVQAKVATNAATKIKTFSQLTQALKEEVASSWAQVWKSIFGDINQAKALFSPLHIAVENFLRNPIDKFNKQLKTWGKLGGRTLFFDTLKKAFQDLGKILHAIHLAFRDIFPAKTGKDLFAMTKGFADLVKHLTPSKQVLDGLRRTFRGVFAVLSIGWYIVKKVIGVFTSLLGLAGHGAGGFLAFTGGIGDFLTALKKAIVDGDALGGVFKGITNILRIPLEIIKALASAFSGLFGSGTQKKVSAAGDAVQGVGDKMKPMTEILKKIRDAVKRTIEFVNKLFKPFSDFVSGIGHFFANLGQTIANALSSGNTDQLLKVANTGLLGGIFLMLKKHISSGNFVVNPLKKLSAVLGGITGNLKRMQETLKAAVLVEIGVAIVTLAAGVKILSSISPKRLTSAMTGVAVGMGMLVTALNLLKGSFRESAALPLIAASMIELAIAVTILSGAVKLFSLMSWDQIMRGLGGIGGSLFVLGKAMQSMDSKQLIVMGPALIAIAIGLNIMAVAVKIFASLSLGDIVKGMIGIAGSLGALKIGLEGLGPELLLMGPGLLAAGFAMTVLAGAVAVFGQMNLLHLIQGVIGMAGALTVLAGGLMAMPPGPEMIAMGAALVLVGIGLTGVAGAIKIMGSMSVGEMAKGLITLGVALVELSVGLMAMSGSALGSVALLGAAAALAILAPALALLGSLSWGTILKGLVAIGGALGVIGVVGIVAAPGLAAIGVALLALGAGVTLVGAGVFLIAKALIMLGDASVKSTGILIAAVTAFVVAIPKMIIEFLKGLVDVVERIAQVAPQLVTAIVKILQNIIQVLIDVAPKMRQAFGVMIDQLSILVKRKSKKLIEAGWTLLLNLLKGWDEHVGEATNHVVSIITKFLNALASRAPALTSAGARAIIAWLNGISKHIVDVVHAGGRVLIKFLKGVGDEIPGVGKMVGRIISRFITAVGDAIPGIAKSAVRMARKFIWALAHALLAVSQVAANAVLWFMNKLADVIEKNARKFVEAGFRIGSAVITGVLEGMASLRKKASDKFGEFLFGNDKRVRAAGIKNLQQLHARGVPRKRLVGLFNPDELDEVYGKPSQHKKHGKMVVHGFAEGVKEGAQKDIPPAADAVRKHGEITIKPKVSVEGVKEGLKKVATDVSPDAPAPKKVHKQALATGIKIGGHMVDGLKLGLRRMLPIMMSSVTVPIGVMLRYTKSLRDFGRFLGGEFRQGLTGGLWSDGKSDAQKQIEGAFKALRAKLGEENGKLRDRIKGDTDNLKQLLHERDKNWGKINGLRTRIAEERALLAQSTDASKRITSLMGGEQIILVKLAAKYEAVTKKLDAARQKLDQLRSDRKQAIKDFADQFGQLPDIGQLVDQAASDAALSWSERWDALRQKQDDDMARSQIDQVALYKQSLKDQITAVSKYMETLNRLRAIGLDDETFKKLLSMGTAGQEFASQLLSGGKGSIDQINALDKQLQSASGALAKNAANSLYNAGIDAAKGLVDGLKKQQSEIRRAMEAIAKAMIMALKNQLGIRSPSRVFAELGANSAQGLADGIANSSNLVTKAAANIGDDAASALTDSLANIADRVQNGINTDVTITPVLDLSQVQKDASKIQDLSNVIPITAAASYGQAAAISDQTQASAAAQAEADAQKVVNFKFEQKNESPKALDEVEIYRNTKNQLSQVKSALGLTK